MDTTGGALGVAVSQGETIISEIFVHNKLTHSATLMPYIEQALFMADMPAEEIEKIAVAVGPGSFTGVRIGAVSYTHLLCRSRARLPTRQSRRISSSAKKTNLPKTGY